MSVSTALTNIITSMDMNMSIITNMNTIMSMNMVT